MFFHNLWSKHNKLYYSSFNGCDLKKIIFKKSLLLVVGLGKIYFQLKLWFELLFDQKSCYNMLVKIMVGIIVVHKMTKKTQNSLLFFK
jgi:hypothetical protein